MKKFIPLLIFIFVSISISNDPLRKPSDINIGKITLKYFLKIHNAGLKEIESQNNYENAKKSLDKYLVNKNFGISFLKEADLSNANLKDLDFRFLNLKETKLLNSDLTNSNLEATNLKEVNVTNANFSNVNLAYADIHEAKGLTLKQLLSCRSLYKTKLPEEMLILIKKEHPELLKSTK